MRKEYKQVHCKDIVIKTRGLAVLIVLAWLILGTALHADYADARIVGDISPARVLKAPPSVAGQANLCTNPDLIGSDFDVSRPISKFIMWEPDRDDPRRADFEYLIGRAGFDDEGEQIFEGRRCERRRGRVFNEFGKFKGSLDSENQRFSGFMVIYGCCSWNFFADYWVDDDTPAGLVEWKSVPPIIVDEGGFTEGIGFFWRENHV